MRLLAALLGFLALCAGPALAQPAPENPVLQHYRAYRAAIAAGDLATADREAVAALAQSVARDGEGGRTGVLALNLAQVKLDRGLAAEAVAPARQAFDIASRNAASGVDPALAKLVLGQAELPTAGPVRLEAALSETSGRADLADVVYSSQMALGEWRLQNYRYPGAQANFAAAAEAGRTNSVSPTYAVARARAREGVAIVMAASRRLEFADAALNTRRGADMGAHAAFTDAVQALEPLALQQTASDLTLAERTYAEALAWREALRARMRLEGDQLPALPASANTACAARIRPVAFAPRDRSEPGAVVYRVRLNAAGAVVDQRVAAAVPADLNGSAVADWRVERAAGGATTCFVSLGVAGS